MDSVNLKLRADQIQREMDGILNGFQNEIQELLRKFDLHHICLDFHCGKEGPHQSTMLFKKDPDNVPEHKEPDPKSIMYYGNNTKH